MQLYSVYVVYIYILLWEFLTIFKYIGTKAFSLLLLRASPSLEQLSLVSVLKWSNIFSLPCKKAEKLKSMEAGCS